MGSGSIKYSHIYLCAFETFISVDKKVLQFYKFKILNLFQNMHETLYKTNIIEKNNSFEEKIEEKYPIPHREYPR